MSVEKLNSIVAIETQQAVAALKSAQNKLGIKHKNSNDSLLFINTRLSKNAGVVNRIRFRFKKSGVFLHKGVGRGTTISQVGSTKRKPKEWFNPIIEKFADDLAEKMADEQVDIIFEKLLIK